MAHKKINLYSRPQGAGCSNDFEQFCREEIMKKKFLKDTVVFIED